MFQIQKEKIEKNREIRIMVNVQIGYNPYTVKTSILLNIHHLSMC